MARPGDESQSPGGFETSAELRRTEHSEAEPEAPPPAMSEPPPAYALPSSGRRVAIAAAVVIVLLVVAVAVYLAA